MCSLVAAAAFAWMPTDAHAQTRTLTTLAWPVYVEYLTVPYGTFADRGTTSPSAFADPVLHLLRDNGDGTFTQVASNDDTPGLGKNARIVWYNWNWGYEEYVLVLRAKSSGFYGTCDLQDYGQTYRTNVPVDGNFISMSTLTAGANDELRTVHHPGGSVAPALFTFDSVDRMHISGVGLGNAVGGASVVDLEGDEDWFLVGTPWVDDHGSYTTLRYGSTMVASNDTSDWDGDGVGNQLESELGTCYVAWLCDPGTEDASDTDRDGLSDGEELFGVAGSQPDGSDDIPFARWGADPMKKDVFLEVDYRTDMGGPIAVGDNPFAWIRANPTVSLGSWPGGTLEAWVDEARAPFDAAPAAQVKNPDGTDGVSLHLDLGLPPLDPLDEAKFGAYGTAAARGVVPPMKIKITGPVDDWIVVAINAELTPIDLDGLTPAQAVAEIAAAMQTSAEPIVVSTPESGLVVIDPAVHGQHFERDLFVLPSAIEENVERPEMTAPEMRDRYLDDPDQVDPVRIGRFRYGVITGVGDGGQAILGRARFVSGTNHGAFMHELGHSLGLSHYGHEDWGNGTEVECMPHYKSLMRYSPSVYRFEDRSTPISLNPAETRELWSFSPESMDQTSFASAPYHYLAPEISTTDWNRDGLISDQWTRWRTTALSLHKGSCKAWVQGRHSLVDGEDVAVTGPVDLTSAEGRIYALWSVGDAIHYRFAPLGPAGDKNCTGSAAGIPGLGDCLTWSSTHTLLSGWSYEGVTAYTFGGDVFVGYNNDSGGHIVYRWGVDAGNGQLSSLGGWSMGSGTTTGTHHTPELTELHTATGGGLALMYLAQDGTFRRRLWTGSGWGSVAALIDDDDDQPITGAEAPVAKAWPPRPGLAGR